MLIVKTFLNQIVKLSCSSVALRSFFHNNIFELHVTVHLAKSTQNILMLTEHVDHAKASEPN